MKNTVTLTINGETKDYIPVDSIPTQTIEFTGEQTLASTLIGKKVIVRSRNEGVNAGIVVLADHTGIQLTECRRIWYHKPKDTSVSWYEGVATTGISSDSKVSCTTEKTIIEDYSVTICGDEAFKSIMEIKPHAQG
jgi:hypothetical protein